MYFTDDSLFPENMQPLIITVAPYGPEWLPGDCDIPLTWDEQVQRAVDCYNAGATVDSLWTDEFMATGAGIYSSGVMPAKETELLSIAFDASYTHMYAPGTRRHIHNALQAGATMEEIMEVLKLCVVQGVQACNLGVPILAEELAGVSAG